jgi:hypothetical protein
MTQELKSYIRIETIVAAAFNFFINGMIAALVYHKADYVPTNAISICLDLVLTCLLMCILSAYFCRASLRRTKTAGILEGSGALLKRFGRLLRYPLLFGLVLGLVAAVILSALTVPLFAWLGIYTLPFGWYVVLKVLFTAVFSGGITRFTLYAGMHKTAR